MSRKFTLVEFSAHVIIFRRRKPRGPLIGQEQYWVRLAGNTNEKTFRHHRQADFGIDSLFTKVKRRDRKKTKVVCLKVSWIFDQMKTGENYTKAGVLAGKLKQFGANTINTIGAHNSERVLWTLSVILCGMLSHLPGTHA
jgi:hypothetical protein